MSEDGEEITTFEKMPRPDRADEFANWLVPARNNIQREMLRLRHPFKFPYIVGYPMWVFRTRRLVLGASFSLWRSVFQARTFTMEVDVAKDGLKFLNEIILNNAALYTTELNTWSLEYYIENAAYRLNHARQLAIEAQVDESLLPKASALGESESYTGTDDFLQSSMFTPFGEWEECLMATRALNTAMIGALENSPSNPNIILSRTTAALMTRVEDPPWLD